MTRPSSIETSDDGRFDFDGVLAGAYSLVARAANGDKQLWAVENIFVSASAPTEVSLYLRAGGSVTGTLRLDESVKEPAPLQLRILLTPITDDGSTMSQPAVVLRSASSSLDPGGRFAMADLSPGTYRVDVLAGDGSNLDPTWEIASLSKDQHEMSIHTLTVKSGETLSGLELVVRRPRR